MSPDAVVVDTLAEIAGSLIDDFDVVDVLTTLADRCVELFGVSGAGMMVATPDGRLAVAASSGPTVQILELLEQQSEEGPCPDCYRSGEPLVDQTMADALDRWPNFAPRALEAGYRSVHALPLRFRGQAFGALNLYSVSKAPLQDSEVRAAQALADLATVTIVQHRALSEAQLLNDQLQHALTSRIAVEQAKGMIAGLSGVDMDTAFSLLRRYGRANDMGLTEVAMDVVSGALAGAEIHPRSTTAPTG